MDDKDKEIYIDRYTERHTRYGYDPRTLGWGGGKEKQDYRFAHLAAVGEMSSQSILDVGCGFGDLYGYLISNGWNGMYLGIDIVPVLIDQAKELWPSAEFKIMDLLTNHIDVHFDYVFASGVFNAKVNNNQEHISTMLKRMYEIANIAVICDFMSTYVDFQQEIAFHTNPEWVFGIAKNLSRRVVLRHDYMPFEFCLYIYKNDDIIDNYIFRP